MDFSLDAKTTAVVLIDLQQGIVGRQLAPHAAADVVKRSVTLADALREKGGTVVFVHVLIPEVPTPPADAPNPRPAVIPPSASELVPELNIQPADMIVAKRSWGAFYGTNLEQHLRRRGVKTIIMAGIATNIGVESTARAAFDHGYELVFAEDAMTTFSAEAQEFAVKMIFPRMGRVRSTAAVVEALR